MTIQTAPNVKSTVVAGEALANARFHTIAMDDGKLAANGKEAGGILSMDGALSGDHIPIIISGGSKYAAGGAVAAGGRLTTTTSGWVTAAASGDHVIGRNGKSAVTSGSIGEGHFDFAGTPYNVDSNA